MITSYLPLLVIAVFSSAFIVAALWLGHRITPRRPTPEKEQTYECGETPIGDTHRPLEIKYYIYVLIFLVFATELIFLIPWAVEFRALGVIAFSEMMIFVAVLLVGWLYVWREGLLEWLR
ncbi:NADH-quinone oxidoreductase subunit A [Candidatus Acetothermia bacterium]|jgi:NADH-quinone oxidoreductase subunit A|nr:NADH-quinone oxidoreductase subunit A [Candidatus Acetothermia bacterium]MCI2432369.1 NADH-quinone oxidoreductase subunit A [Candidatus Acetothermia bacterium]MCI2435805.1 NADH-quinone oxidoreductase subunit A [Candidatus Acetothermia bacterium]